MDSLFLSLAGATGASVDQIKLITCLVISYPLGSIFVRIPRSKPALRHVFSIVISTIYLIPVLNLGLGAIQLLFITLITYVLSATLHGRYMPWVVFSVAMGHLTFNHVYRALHEIPFETFEITGPQMVLTMKLTTYAWNVYDGRRPSKDLDKWQLKHRVVTIPSLLEFLGYAFYFPGILVGPYTEYVTYAALIDGSLFEHAEGQVYNGQKRKYVPHGRKRVAYTRMLTGFGCMGTFVLLGSKYSYVNILSDAWLKKGFLDRFFTLQLIGIVTRTKYYSVWLLTEGASILTGLGFTGYTPSGGSQWDGAANVNIRVIEWAPNFKMMIDSWNMKTNVWLRETVYKRVARKGKKPGFKSTMSTFVTSAFWHGIAAGYYLTFLVGGFISAAGRQCRANLRPLFLPPVIPEADDTSAHESKKRTTSPSPSTLAKHIYDFVGCFSSTALMNFVAVPFVIGGFYDSLEAWRRLYWYGIWATIGTLAFFILGGKAWTHQLAKQRIRYERTRHEEMTKGVKVSLPNGKHADEASDSFILPPVDVAMRKAEKKLEH